MCYNILYKQFFCSNRLQFLSEREEDIVGLRKFSFNFGRTTQEVELPEERISSIIEGRPVPAVDVEQATLEAMRHPIGCRPLQEMFGKGDKVCLVIADVTRSWNRSSEYVIHVVNELNLAGVSDEDMYIVFAQGTHREQTPEENVRVVGEEVARRIRMYQHHCRNNDELTCVGTTRFGTRVMLNKRVVEADKIVIIDGITAHLFAGYGGGRKLLLPGVAGWDTIQENHCHALADHFGDGINPKTRNGVLQDNPVNYDMLDAMEMVKPTFLVHSIINNEGKICRMVAGDPYQAWLEGTRICHDNQAVSFKARADVTFACAGGYPKDVSLYQGCKCYDPADVTTKPGGIIIAIMEASDLYEPPEYLGSFKYDSEKDMEKALRENFSIPFFVAFNLFCMTHRYTIYLVTKKENFDAIRKTNQIPCATVAEAWEKAQAQLAREGKKDYTLNLIPHCGGVIAEEPEK